MEKYENLGLVGEGSYGMVMKCRHRESSQLVAIKKFLETENDKMVKKIALREVKMLKQLHHENLVNLIEVFRRKKRLFLVFEFVDRTALDDLEKYPAGADENYVKKVMWQVLKGIDFCHTHNVIHRDIKPENILISKRGVVKICDFGFARLIAPPGEAYTDYVATRWYRSPELLVGDTNYGKSVDVWAVGCLFSEMLTGEPLFPGESDIDQLYLITKCFGNLIAKHREVFSRNPLFIGMRLPEARELDPLERRYPRLSSASMDIIKWSLRLDPSDRPTCAQLLRHELFQRNGWADKYSLELRSKIQQELDENPLLKNLGITAPEPTNPRHHPAAPPHNNNGGHKIRPEVGHDKSQMDRLMVNFAGTGTIGGGFSSGTEGLYSGAEDMGTIRKKEKKKKVKKESVLHREKAHPDISVLKASHTPHLHSLGVLGGGIPRSPIGSRTSLHKPATPINKSVTPAPLMKPTTPMGSRNFPYYQTTTTTDVPPIPVSMGRQLSNTSQTYHPPPMMAPPPMMPPTSDPPQLAMFNTSRLRDLHSTSNVSVGSQHDARSDRYAPRMENPASYFSPLSPSQPPPYKKSPSANVELPQLPAEHYVSSLVSKPVPSPMIPPQQNSYSQMHTHVQRNDNDSHLLGSGSQIGRGGNYFGSLKMEQPSSPSRLRRTQEIGSKGYLY